MADALLTFRPEGIHCAAGGFHIDPWRPVDRALITHGHADHARPGHLAYLCTDAAAPVLCHRLGEIALETIAYGETRRIGGADVSFHPAGHVPGAAQIRVEVGGEVWVVSGDYKLADDGLTPPFVPLRCHAFVTECTFGLPVFRWRTQAEVARQINAWWASCAAEGRTAMLGAYSLGKAQRLLRMLDPSQGPIICHAAIENTNDVMRAHGIALPETIRAGPETTAKAHPGALVLAPTSAVGSAWAKRFQPLSDGFASGWMALRGVRRRRAADRGFVISDHADWDGLNAAIAATGAERIFVTHGYTEVFRAWLETQGFEARIVQTEFVGEAAEAEDPEAAEA